LTDCYSGSKQRSGARAWSCRSTGTSRCFCPESAEDQSFNGQRGTHLGYIIVIELSVQQWRSVGDSPRFCLSLTRSWTSRVRLFSYLATWQALRLGCCPN